MIQKKTWLTALTLALALPLGAEASVYGVMNQVGVSGNVQGATNRYGNTNGGLGLRASLYNGGLFGTAKYRHEFGATYQGYTGGNTNTIGLKLGYLFNASNILAVGPYVGYEYNRFAQSNAYYDSHSSLSTNGLGGGLYAAASLPGVNFTGYVGYLGGISETQHLSRFAPTTFNRTSDLLQMGVNAYYPLMANVSLYVGLHDDDFTLRGAPNILRGDVGLGMQF
ncbi:hypothetical protein A6M27_05990 [Acidithiobacillus thiooxidans]|uniref:Uncharacterized protein n=1 Tax=Acidithiobacillus montserratensis TaxID=2729135 RepID=A0ACD5HF07_9PROT|nr:MULTISPECIES: hypothetical protein [Acidithiobacillus]MBU2748566.1 hypothetical protein [Acidithiobacillus montserratensis]OCX78038.1 hypothetical protein A6O24_05510 [Acidithiobacillus thiooxidans]OCX83942.1 hypothetical protein A6O26_05825 [Acidithiobacillus thiooxidans]OCX88730.1 hypothetical protein A6M27_05990 [Acidithiobacillus thiooxidans]OFC48235.1 hypothetical protein BAE47_08055 [Acidithiobacillus thiooxidans]